MEEAKEIVEAEEVVEAEEATEEVKEGTEE